MEEFLSTASAYSVRLETEPPVLGTASVVDGLQEVVGLRVVV